MKRLLVLLILFPLLFGCFRKEKPSELYVNGRIEGDEYDVGTKYPGRVVRVFHDEGDSVRKGELLALIDSKEINARLKEAEENYNSLLLTVKAKEREVKYYREKLSAERLRLSELSKTVELQIERAEDSLKASLSRLDSARANYEKALSAYRKAEKDYKRYRRLYERRVISESSFDAVKLSFETARANLEAARSSLGEAEALVNSSRSALAIARERRKEVKALSREVKALEETVAAKEVEVGIYRKRAEAAEAAVDEIKATISDLSIVSPISGTITEKLVEPGEVVASGQRLFTLYNLDKLYFEGYIPEDKIGLVHLGQKGYVVVDSYPHKKFPVVVSYVSSRAEFTPKEVQTKEERVKEVFRVKMRLLENPNHLLKPGMPADCYLELKRK